MGFLDWLIGRSDAPPEKATRDFIIGPQSLESSTGMLTRDLAWWAPLPQTRPREVARNWALASAMSTSMLALTLQLGSVGLVGVGVFVIGLLSLMSIFHRDEALGIGLSLLLGLGLLLTGFVYLVFSAGILALAANVGLCLLVASAVFYVGRTHTRRRVASQGPRFARLMRQVRRYNELVHNLDVAERIEAAQEIEPSREARAKIHSTLGETRKRLCQALETDKLLRENPDFETESMVGPAAQALMDPLEGFEVAREQVDALREALEIAEEVKEEMQTQAVTTR